jgi:diguanylate cyclase (GGDEF)-like protein
VTPESNEGLLHTLSAELGRGCPVAIIYSDLDNFKSVNDKLGHVAGDRCVAEFEKLVAKIVEGKGTVCRRYATGDEFVVILPNFITSEAAAVAERIRAAVEQSRIGGEIPITASLGVHGSDVGQAGEAEELLHLADQMMYQAKQTKNTVASPATGARMIGPAELTRSIDQWMRDSGSRWETVARDRISGENRSLYYAWGAWSIAYAIAAVPSARLSLSDLLETLEKMPGQTRCLRPWHVAPAAMRPYPFERTLECWPTASADGFSPEFWRASPELRMFYLRKHEEDELLGAGHVLPASRKLVIHRPILRIAECVVHASRLTRALGLPPGPVAFRARWTGLSGRRMAKGPGGALDADHECQQDAVESEATATTADFGKMLHDATGALLTPLYEAFNLYRLEDQTLHSEIENMLNDCTRSR